MFQIVEDTEKIELVIRDTVRNLLNPIDYISVNQETLSKITGMKKRYLEENLLNDERIKIFKRKKSRTPYWLTEINLGADKKYLRDTIVGIMNEWN
ncbi:hypothetical protein ACOJIU_04185 [Carnobacterium maltaromaticum]|uniref:hypothetical protein n=1 Tax=Carnobacterium maltaromaticum TaxID=2751 RepID=UPI003B987C7B